MTRLKREQWHFWGVAAGTIVVALCCFTPILVITLVALGLHALVPYLDTLLFPALFVLLVLTYWTYQQYRKECARCEVTSVKEERNIST